MSDHQRSEETVLAHGETLTGAQIQVMSTPAIVWVTEVFVDCLE